MIRANCRARFTAADFDFIVRTLAHSRGDNVSLVELLSDSETRDSILDHPKLVETILNNAGQLRISSQFYFYVLARHVLREAGIGDRKLSDYIGSLLETFSRANQLQSPDKIDNRAHQYISDMLIALKRATPEQSFLLRAHVGNYSLFVTGIFHENTHRRSLRGAPDLEFYEQIGRANYQVVASHETARRCELNDVFKGLADRFHDVRLALNDLSDRLLHLDEAARPQLVL
jgi:phage gp46-like protein